MVNEERTYDYDGTKLAASDIEKIYGISKGKLRSAKKDRYGYWLRWVGSNGGPATGFLSFRTIDKYLAKKYSKQRKWEGGLKGLDEFIKQQLKEATSVAQHLANVIDFITLHRNQWSIQFGIDPKYVDNLLASGISSKNILSGKTTPEQSKALKDLLDVMNRKTNGNHWITKY